MWVSFSSQKPFAEMVGCATSSCNNRAQQLLIDDEFNSLSSETIVKLRAGKRAQKLPIDDGYLTRVSSDTRSYNDKKSRAPQNTMKVSSSGRAHSYTVALDVRNQDRTLDKDELRDANGLDSNGLKKRLHRKQFIKEETCLTSGEEKKPFGKEFSKAVRAAKRVKSEVDLQDFNIDNLGKTRLDCEVYLSTPGTPFFNGGYFCGVKLPAWLAAMSYEQAYIAITSLRAYKPGSTRNPTEAAQAREFARQCREVSKSWLEDLDEQNKLRFLLIRSFSKAPQLFENHKATVLVKPFESYKLCNDQLVICPLPDGRHFVETTTTRKNKIKTEPALMNYSVDGEGWLYKYVQQYPVSKIQLMSIAKLKSTIKSWSNGESNKDVVEAKLYEKLPPIRLAKHLTIEIFRKQMWMLNFLRPEHYALDCPVGRDEDFLRVMHSLFGTLRERLLALGKRYINLLYMPVGDKKQGRKDQKKQFIALMKSAEIQNMFIRGVPKQDIVNHIFQTNQDKLQKAFENGADVEDQRYARKTTKVKEIKKARDAKYAFMSVDEDCDYPPINNKPQAITTKTQVAEVQIGKPITYTPLEGYEVQCGTAEDYRLVAEILAARLNMANIDMPDFFEWFRYRCRSSFLFAKYKFERWYESLEMAYQIYRVKAWIMDPRRQFDSHTTLQLLELKSLFHIFFHFYNGNNVEAANWLSNFSLTRPDVNKYVFATCAGLCIKDAIYPKTIQVVHDGQLHTIPVEHYKWYTHFYAKKDKVMIAAFEESFKPYVQQQAWTQDVLKIFENFTGPIDVKDLAKLNQHFVFARNMFTTMRTTQEYLRYFVSLCGRLCLSYDPFNEEYQQYVVRMVDYAKKIEYWSIRADSLHTDRKVLAEVVQTFESMSEDVKSPLMEELSYWLATDLTAKYRLLKNLAENALAMLGGSIKRVEPLFVMFCGKPGSGKSTTCNYIMEFIHQEDCKKPFSPESCYVYNSSSTYWEKYAQQKFVLMDDMFKEADVTLRSAQATSVIGMVNSMPFNLNMAFGGKGSNFFNSEYVFASTNLEPNGFTEKSQVNIGLTDPGAFMRRIHLCLVRNERFQGEVSKLTYLVKHCTLYPEYDGRTIEAVELAYLCKMCKKKQEQLFKENSKPSKGIAADVNEIGKERFETRIGVEIQCEYKNDAFEFRIRDLEENLFSYFWFERKKKYEDENNYFERLFYSRFCSPTRTHITLTDAEDFVRMYNYPLLDKDFDGKVGSITDMVMEDRHFREHYMCAQHEWLKLPSDPNYTVFRNETHKIWCRKHLPATTYNVVTGETENEFNIGNLSHYETIRYNFKLWSAHFKNIDAFWKYLVGTLVFVLVTLAVVPSLIRYLFPKTEELQEFEADMQSRAKKQHGTAVTHVKKKLELKPVTISLAKPKISVQSGDFEEVNERLKSMASFNTSGFILAARARGVGTVATSVGFMVRNGYAGGTRHFFNKLDPEKEYDFFIETTSGLIKSVTIENLLTSPGLDFVLFYLGNVSGLTEMYKHMQSAESFIDVTPGSQISIITPSENGSIYNFANRALLESYSYSAGSESFYVDSPVAYTGFSRGPTKPGQSGSMVVVPGPQGKPVFIGIHCILITERQIGAALIITKEMVDALLSHVTEVQSSNEVFPLAVTRYVPPSEAHFPAKRSKIKRSALYPLLSKHWGQPEYIPAHLTVFEHYGEVINPLHVGVSKFSQEYFNVAPPSLKQIEYMQTMYPQQSAKVYSLSEVINSEPTLGTVGMCMSTSAGYPHSLEKKKGKTGLFDQVGDRYEYKSQFYEHMRALHDKLYNGGNHEFLWADSLKDETRPKEKVNKGKTRVFSCAPVEHTILGRMYFLDFIMYVQKSCIDKPISVGINAHSNEWKYLYDRLNQKKACVLACDVANFDGTVRKQEMEAFVNFVNWWYDDGEANARMRHKIFEPIYCCMHIVYDKVYKVCDSMPSGMFATAIVNSFVQTMRWAGFFIDHNLHFNQFQLAVYGDDNVATSEKVFTYAEVQQYMQQKYGATYTHWSKAEFVGVDSLADISYLGRKFVVNEDGYISAPLELRTILESVYWVRGAHEALKSTVESAFIELSHHGREVFNYYTKQILEAVVKLPPHESFKPQVHSFSYYYDGMHNPIMLVKFDPYSAKGLAKSREAVQLQSGDINSSEKYFPQPTMQQIDTSIEKTPLGVMHNISNSDCDDMAAKTHENLHSQNMETFDIQRIMEREYILGTATWTTDQAVGSELARLYFPKNLFDIPAISRQIIAFEYFKADIELTVRITSSDTNFGSIIACYTPMGFRDPQRTELNDPYVASGRPHIVLSASQSDCATLCIPFIYNRRFLSLREHADSEMCEVVLSVLTKLTNAFGTTDSAKYTVTARFVNVELSMPKYVVQSNEEAHIKAESGSISSLLDGISKTAAYVGANITSHPYVTLVKDVTQYSARMMRNAGMDKPMSLDRGTICKIDPYSDLNNCGGVSTAVTLGSSYEAEVATGPLANYTNTDEMDLNVLGGTPVITRLINPSGLGNFLISTLAQPEGEMGGVDSINDSITRRFVFKSGGDKIMIKFFLTNQMKARGVFYITNSTTEVFGNWTECYHQVVDLQGDCTYTFTIPYIHERYMMHHFDRRHVLMFQLLSNSSPAEVDVYPQIVVYKASAPDAKYYTYMDYATIRESDLEVQSNPRVDFAQEFPMFHESMRMYAPQGISCPDVIMNVRDLLHKEYAIGQNNGNDLCAVPVFPGNGDIALPADNWETPTNIRSGISDWKMFYRFFRGSTELRVISRNTDFGNTPLHVQLNRYGNNYDTYVANAIATSDNCTSTVKVNAPFMQNALFHRNEFAAHDIDTEFSINKTLSSTLHTNNYLAGRYLIMRNTGDDFSFHFIIRPPAHTVYYREDELIPVTTPGAIARNFFSLQQTATGV